MPASYRDLVGRAKQEIREIDPAELEAIEPKNVVVLDVREQDEYEQGAIPGALLVPRGVLESAAATYLSSADTPVVLYCAVGARSALAAKTLQDMGYADVRSLAGGFGRWKNEGRPWNVPTGLSGEQRERYSRHLVLPEVGEEGQAALLAARVLILGAGGLSSPAAMYLAAAGVGTVGLVDFDVVDLSNLQRQILHSVDRIGHEKVESARDTLLALNPEVKFEGHSIRLSAGNVLDLMSGYDVVIDGTDNFPTRYLVNDAALHLRVPVVHGSIFRFEGQATVFRPYDGPCYRCLFPEPPPPELAPNCAEAGVLGVLPGIIGSIQALEAIKLILERGDPLVGRLLTFDALEDHFTTLNILQNPSCPACGDEARPPALVDYDDLCLPAGTTARGV